MNCFEIKQSIALFVHYIIADKNIYANACMLGHVAGDGSKCIKQSGLQSCLHQQNVHVNLERETKRNTSEIQST